MTSFHNNRLLQWRSTVVFRMQWECGNTLGFHVLLDLSLFLLCEHPWKDLKHTVYLHVSFVLAPEYVIPLCHYCKRHLPLLTFMYEREYWMGTGLQYICISNMTMFHIFSGRWWRSSFSNRCTITTIISRTRVVPPWCHTRPMTTETIWTYPPKW